MEVTNSKINKIVSIIIFILVIAFLYFFLFHGNKTEKEENNNETNLTSSGETYSIKKIDESKDYIYFTDGEVISDHLEIYYQTPVININTDEIKAINVKLKANVDGLRKSVEKTTLEEEIEICEDAIRSAKIEYNEVFKYKNYMSLVLYDTSISCFGNGDYRRPSAYTIDLNSGKILSFDELLAMYNITAKTLNNKIKDYLIESQEQIAKDDPELANLIKIDETLATFEVNKTLAAYIDKRGNLIVDYVVVVIDSRVNYNDTMIINNKGEIIKYD